MLTVREAAAAVRELREGHGWSQSELAGHAGVSRSFVADLEAGKPTVEAAVERYGEAARGIADDLLSGLRRLPLVRATDDPPLKSHACVARPSSPSRGRVSIRPLQCDHGVGPPGYRCPRQFNRPDGASNEYRTDCRSQPRTCRSAGGLGRTPTLPEIHHQRADG
ncbi:helix-turn-helix domain-containing protein [Nakamurella lactea]|uniref:helix-turn-helix domain-containing protein n=1 Tax=Nakamurella lactea TaxID=459515 RepID=UPI00389922D7